MKHILILSLTVLSISSEVLGAPPSTDQSKNNDKQHRSIFDRLGRKTSKEAPEVLAEKAAFETAQLEGARLFLATMAANHKYDEVRKHRAMQQVDLVVDTNKWKTGQSSLKVGGVSMLGGVVLMISPFIMMSHGEGNAGSMLFAFGAGAVATGVGASLQSSGVNLMQDEKGKLSEKDLALFKAGYDKEVRPQIELLAQLLNWTPEQKEKFLEEIYNQATNKMIQEFRNNGDTAKIVGKLPEIDALQIVGKMELATPEQIKALEDMRNLTSSLKTISKDGPGAFQNGPWRTQEEFQKMSRRSQELDTQIQSLQQIRNLFKEVASDDSVRKNPAAHTEAKRIVADANKALQTIEDLRSSVKKESKKPQN